MRSSRGGARSPDRRLFRDGPVDDAAYCSAPKRVVFVLKEVNETKPEEWDLCQYVREEARGQTWNNVVRWVRTILWGATWDEVESVQPDRGQILAPIAVVNLNKHGGGATTDPVRLKRAAEEARDLLVRQIEILDPHLVVSCGGQTGDLAGEVIFGFEPKEWKKVEGHRGVWVGPSAAGRSLITVPHPQARRSAKGMHEGLVAAMDRSKLLP
jgi:hypothetical protein